MSMVSLIFFGQLSLYIYIYIEIYIHIVPTILPAPNSWFSCLGPEATMTPLNINQMTRWVNTKVRRPVGRLGDEMLRGGGTDGMDGI